MSRTSGCGGAFRFDVVSAVAGVAEGAALDALDAALAAQVVRPTGGPDVYEFTHALIQGTLADEISLTRRARLHARIAELLEGPGVETATA